MESRVHREDDRVLWRVVVNARSSTPGVVGRIDRPIHVCTDKGLEKAAALAVEWLGKAWIDKKVVSIERVGDVVVEG